MSEILVRHQRIADEIAREDPEAAALLQEEQARLMVASTLQEALEHAIEGSDLASIERSMLSEQSGLSTGEIYGLAHADRAYPLILAHVYRLLQATGHTLGLVPLAVAA